MYRLILTCLVVLTLGEPLLAQKANDPPLIAKMEAVGTVYLTRRLIVANSNGARVESKPNAIYGLDFRPTAGTDSKKIAALVKELSSLPDLQMVLLLGQDVTDEAVEALPATLLSVQLYNTKVTDKGITQLTRCKKLQIFTFSGMGITDAGMKELGKIKTLQTITIRDAKISNAGVLALKDLAELRRLTVENTLATEVAIAQLRLQLPMLQSGERLLG